MRQTKWRFLGEGFQPGQFALCGCAAAGHGFQAGVQHVELALHFHQLPNYAKRSGARKRHSHSAACCLRCTAQTRQTAFSLLCRFLRLAQFIKERLKLRLVQPLEIELCLELLRRGFPQHLKFAGGLLNRAAHPRFGARELLCTLLSTRADAVHRCTGLGGLGLHFAGHLPSFGPYPIKCAFRLLGRDDYFAGNA